MTNCFWNRFVSHDLLFVPRCVSNRFARALKGHYLPITVNPHYKQLRYNGNLGYSN
jgi:hypothetical protein